MLQKHVVGLNAVKCIYYLCHILLVSTNICIPTIAYNYAMFGNQRKAISIYQCGKLFFLSLNLF